MKKEELRKRVQERQHKDMEPCPLCGGKDLSPQTPIQMDSEEIDFNDPDAAKKLLGLYVRTMKNTGGLLKGPVYFICKNCRFKGGEVDCTGRTSIDVGKDKEVYKKMKQEWNKKAKASRGIVENENT